MDRGEDPGGAGKRTPNRLAMGGAVQAGCGRMEPQGGRERGMAGGLSTPQ